MLTPTLSQFVYNVICDMFLEHELYIDSYKNNDTGHSIIKKDTGEKVLTIYYNVFGGIEKVKGDSPEAKQIFLGIMEKVYDKLRRP